MSSPFSPGTPPNAADIRYRQATAADAGPIAALHAQSWRRHYRGAYADTFLDGDLVADRLAVWSVRLAGPADAAPGRTATVLAERGGQLAGFVHVEFEHDRQWGSLVDNLHVVPDLHRSGIGSRLLRRGARAVVEYGGHAALYLWVLEQNTAAQQFYLACGARRGQATAARPPRGNPKLLNGAPRKLRMSWPDAAELARLA